MLQLLPGNYKPGTRLSLTAAAHAPFGISTDSLHWAAGGLTRRGLSGKYHLLGCGREDGEIITHHLGFLLAHSCSIIFGNGCQHEAEADSQHFGFKGINTLEWPGSAKQLLDQGSSTAGHLAHNGQLSSFWLFSHLVQTCHHPVLCKQLTLIKVHWLSLLSQEPGDLGSSPVLK